MEHAAAVVYQIVSNKIDGNCCRIKANIRMNNSNQFLWFFNNESEHILLFSIFHVANCYSSTSSLFRTDFLLFFPAIEVERRRKWIDNNDWNIHGIELCWTLFKEQTCQILQMVHGNDEPTNSKPNMNNKIIRTDEQKSHSPIDCCIYFIWFYFSHCGIWHPCSRHTTLHSSCSFI